MMSPSLKENKGAGASNFPGNDYDKSIAPRQVAAIEEVGELNCLIKNWRLLTKIKM